MNLSNMNLPTNLLTIFQPSPMKIVNYQDIHSMIENKKYILINVLSSDQQKCLIQNTLFIDKEEETINNYVENFNTSSVKIALYGKNCGDYSVLEKKNKQFVSLGFDTFVYLGGLFEWLLLQDIFGFENFPTTTKILDILDYSYPSKLFSK